MGSSQPSITLFDKLSTALSTATKRLLPVMSFY